MTEEELKALAVSQYQLSKYDGKIKEYINAGKINLVGNDTDNFDADSKYIFLDSAGMPMKYAYIESVTIGNTALAKAFIARKTDNTAIYVYEQINGVYKYQFTVPSTSDEFVKYNRLLDDTSTLVATKILAGNSSDDWTQGRYSVFVDSDGQPMAYAFLPSLVVGSATYTNVFLARKTDASAIYVYELAGTTYCYQATILSTAADYATYNNALNNTSELANKVDKDGDKVLSDNNYTTEEKNKLADLDNYDDTEIKEQISQKATKATTLAGYGITDAATTEDVSDLTDRVANVETTSNDAKNYCKGVSESLAQTAAGQTDAQVASNTGNIAVLLEKVQTTETNYTFEDTLYGQILVSDPQIPTSTDSSSLNKVMKIDITSDMVSVSAYVAQVNASMYVIAFFDANENFVSGVKSGSGADTYTCDIPSNAKTMYICNRTALLAQANTVIEITLVGTVVQKINAVTRTVEQCNTALQGNTENISAEQTRAQSAEAALQTGKSGNVFSDYEWLNKELIGLYIDTDAEDLRALLAANEDRHWLTVQDGDGTVIAQFLIKANTIVKSNVGTSATAYAHFGDAEGFAIHTTADITIYDKVKYLSSSPTIGLYLKSNYDDQNISKNTFTDSAQFNAVIQEMFLDIAEEYKTEDLIIKSIKSAGRAYNWISIFSGDTLIVQFPYIAGSVQVSSYGSRSYALFSSVDDSLLNQSATVSTTAFDNGNSPSITAYIGQTGNTVNVVNNYNKLLFNNMMIYGSWKDYSLIDFAGSGNVVSCDLIGFMFTDFPVGISLCTKTFDSKEYQIAAFYNVNHRMCIAMRIKTSDTWGSFSFYEFDNYVGWDSHNYVVAVFDADGYIHVSGNMHSNRLVYYMSTSPLSVSSFDKKTMINDDNEIRVTYPCFIPTNDNRFLFLFRNGYSGNGDTFINEYKNGSWERICKFIDGTSSVDSAYFFGGLNTGNWNGYYNSATGYYEIAFMMRASGDAIKCHDIFYVKTKDFISFYNRANTLLTLPLTVDSDCKVVSIEQGSGLTNAICAKLITDFGYLVVYHKYDENGYSQLYATLITETSVITNQVTNWTDTYNISGTGSMTSAISINGLIQSTYNDADCFMIRASFNGVSNRFVLDTSLQVLVTDNNGITSDLPSLTTLQSLENTAQVNGSNLVSVSITRDLMMPEKYAIRKETMPTNSDVARNIQSALPTSVKIAELSL